ncbi:MAG: hypothetical protein KF779_00755 [Hyphomonadaceae bacterium]|nr:hypothetical protein [Hyphomonadaceae bacterium]MCA8885265.1 hypothetical protein [Hyphomonadaceae bacterium]
MAFVLRWPAILVMLAVVLFCVAGALGAAGLIADFQAPSVGVEQVDTQVAQAQSAAAQTGAANATWIDVGLLAAAAVLFLISAIRLIRRTQAFWTWLLGFAAYGGRWAWSQQYNEGGVAGTIRGVDIGAFTHPQALLNDLGSPSAQVGILGIILIVGLFVFIVDAVDRAHWDKQGA